jgi:oligoribonuclease NrnB/cAMP/cGMP phosphodiesterase (DHH superfamily)
VNISQKPLCIYHGNCADGFAAAWAVRKYFGKDKVDFYAGIHQDPPPDVGGRTVYIVDFSYKRPVLLEMASKAKQIVVIDHHKTAQIDLVDLPENVEVNFDLCRSGAMLTWDYFFTNQGIPGECPPTLLRHIQDRDLWRFELDGTREIQAAVFSYPYEFDVWDDLMDADMAQLRREGSSIERKHFKDIREFITAAAYRMDVAGHNVPVLNAPYFWSSDAGHIMAENEPFAACYWDTPAGRVFSLRSQDDGIDVSEIAKQFGGGGHKHAAGYRINHGAAS